LNLTRIHLGEFSARIDSEIAPQCATKGLAWKLDMVDVLVKTDAELLLRLFRNLLTNAVQYTDRGEVYCSAKLDDGRVEFLITDTGRGIANEHQVSVFKEFVRLEKNGVQSPGAGLGLSIVENINKSLDLGLEMSSTLEKGTRFSFRMPIAAVVG
jgi:signal transduction histidine kinase